MNGVERRGTSGAKSHTLAFHCWRTLLLSIYPPLKGVEVSAHALASSNGGASGASLPLWLAPVRCIQTCVSMPLWLALMGLLTQIYKPLPWYRLNDMVMELADWDQTAESSPLWLTPLDLLSLNSWKSWLRMGMRMPFPSPRAHRIAEAAPQQTFWANS